MKPIRAFALVKVSGRLSGMIDVSCIRMLAGEVRSAIKDEPDGWSTWKDRGWRVRPVFIFKEPETVDDVKNILDAIPQVFLRQAIPCLTPDDQLIPFAVAAREKKKKSKGQPVRRGS